MRTKITLLLGALLLSSGAFADDLNDEKKAAIRELMEMTGAHQLPALLTQSMGQKITQLLQQRVPISPEAAATIRKETEAAVGEALSEGGSYYEAIYPVYHQHFSLEEIRALIAFNKSPAGRKMAQVMPSLVQDTAAAGQRWGQEAGPAMFNRVVERLQKEGLVKLPDGS
jgi:hypothetical protein